MNGENGYKVEKKAEACTSSSLSFSPTATIYRHDDFADSIDPNAWSARAAVQTSTIYGIPANASDASGSADVNWENGAVKLHTVANDMNDAGYNSSSIDVRHVAAIVGDGDFDIQFDYSLPNGTISTTEYHVYARLSLSFPATAGGNNNLYLERRNNNLDFIGMTIDGMAEYGSMTNTNLSGKLRLVKSKREMAAYAWNGTDWQLLLKHSYKLTAELTPSWISFIQYVRRNEPGGQDVTAVIDNFRLNSVGGIPVAKLHLDMDEPIWQGNADEVLDRAADTNHGTSYNGPTTTTDLARGTVGSFDGVDDYIEISGSGALENVTDSSFTFAAWTKPMSVPPHTDQAPPDGPADDWIHGIMGRPGWHTDLHYNQNKQFRFEMWNDASTQFGINSTAYDPGQWHHLAGVVDNTAKTVTLYVDGLPVGSTPYTGNPRDYGTLPYYIGTSNHDASAYNWYFDGMIDDVRIFDRALSATEVETLYSNKMSYNDSGLTAGTEYCYQIYPFQTDTCPNWVNHGAKSDGTTLDAVAGNATYAGTATAVNMPDTMDIYVNMPFLGDNNGNNTYTVEYKLSSSGTWITHIAGAPHTTSPYATTISGLAYELYDVRVTYNDADGVNGIAQQTIHSIRSGVPLSCVDIINKGGSTGDGVYSIDPDGAGGSAPYQVYCDMTTDGGGWTLAMKMDGSQSTFEYAATYWTTTNTLNPGSPDFNTTQAKLQSYNNLAFTQIRLGMRLYSNATDDIDWITVNQASTSLHALISPGTFTATTVGRTAWLNLLEGVNTQPYCNKEGFNSVQAFSKMRIGLAMNQENNCDSCDRILGFGNEITGHPWGDWAVVGGGYPGSNTIAYGWILVR
jgi:hypothetical protein